MNVFFLCLNVNKCTKIYFKICKCFIEILYSCGNTCFTITLINIIEIYDLFNLKIIGTVSLNVLQMWNS